MHTDEDFLNTPLGALDSTPGSTPVEDGWHLGVVSKIVPERNRKGVLQRDDNDKVRVKIGVTLDDGTELQRTTSISFGKNSETNKFAVWAQFIEAATATPCGDAEQRNYTVRELMGLRIAVRTRFTGGWTNIEEFAQLDRIPGRRAPQPVQERRAQTTPPMPIRRERSEATTGTSAQQPQTKEEPSPGGQQRIRTIAADFGLDDATLLGAINDVAPGKSIEQLSARECASVSVRLSNIRYKKSA